MKLVTELPFLTGNEACEVQICNFGSVWCARVRASNTALIESIPSEHQKVKLQSAADNNAIRYMGMDPKQLPYRYSGKKVLNLDSSN